MEKSCPVSTNAKRRWLPYVQYNVEEDQTQRSGVGENHWSSPESLEWYTGKLVRGAMHGQGEYRWRHKGSEGSFVSYEGWFHVNRMHGYGVISYPNGRVFNGLFYNNMRWGPGIESNTRLQENVGLWRGNQLVRLAWRPETPNVTLDLNSSPHAKACVEPHRTLLIGRVRTVGETNSAIELLKQSGATPITASQKWTKLYPKHCTDLASQVCDIEFFDQEYYKTKIYDLEVVDSMPQSKEKDTNRNSQEDYPNPGTYYAWNNSVMMVNMMQHCFKHEEQRDSSGIDLKTILAGLRTHYKRAAKHELDCRTLIMASYLGHITNVAQLINEDEVHPDVADILGNTALMYAACGDQKDVVHFLVEAGANVNNYNDSCCTPLGTAMMKFACGKKGIAASGMVKALVPPSIIVSSQPLSSEVTPTEWHISRDTMVAPSHNNTLLTKSFSKTGKSNGSMKSKSTISQDRLTGGKRKAFSTLKILSAYKVDGEDTGMFFDEKRVYSNVNTEFSIKVIDLFSVPNASNTSYLFDVVDMTKDMENDEEDSTKKPDKNTRKSVIKVIKDITQPSQDTMWQGSDKRIPSLSSADRAKIETLNRNMSTIVQLLKDGADPRLVRCPQPALRIAVASGSPELVRHLVKYGADINEVYPDALNYTALDVAVSQPLTHDNLELIRAILECGATADHRLRYTHDVQVPEIPGPTLLHVVISRKIENEDSMGEEVRRQLLELLLEYNCDALTQFKGRSAMDMVMTNIDLLDIFVQCPKIDLNAPINSLNQTVLVKMFSLHYFQTNPVSECLETLTELLLYGADPLMECQDADVIYPNIFVLAINNLITMGGDVRGAEVKQSSFTDKQDLKGKKIKEKPKEEKPSAKNTVSHHLEDYKQALDLVTECARMLYVRWIQAKLLKELIQVVEKYEHRHWNMILPEYKSKKACGLWLTYPRALEIWDILKAGRKKKNNDRRVLKHVLCIVQFNCIRSKGIFKRPVTAEEKYLIETDVMYFLREHNISKSLIEQVQWARSYVTPELTVGAERKFQVCFECILPLEDQRIQCTFCRKIFFCSLECMKLNIDRVDTDGYHPCSKDLKNKHSFPLNEYLS